MKRDKKGFTLIEIIVTIALLAIIGTIITVNLVGLNNKQKEKEKARTESIIAAAAESYIGVEGLKIDNNACITTQFLIDNNYLKKSSVPNDYLNSSVTKDSNGNYLVYLYSDKCINIDPDNGIGSKKKEYTLTYMKKDNKTVLSSEKFIKGKVRIKKNTESKTGYNFSGWATSANGKVTYKEDTEYNLKGKNYTLYPIWQKKQYTITYNYNDGKTKNKTQKADYNTNITLSTPKKEGYKFVGWKVGNTSTVVNKNYTVTSNITLTAQWQEEIPIKILAGIYDKVMVNGKNVSLSKVGDLDYFYLDGESIGNSQVSLHISDKNKDYINRLKLEQLDMQYSQYNIRDINIDNDYITFSISKDGVGEDKEIILDPFLNFDIYTPVSNFMGYISYIVTESVEYEYLDEIKQFNNTDYKTIRFKVYDIDTANVNIMFKKKRSSYVDNTYPFELVKDNETASGYNEYTVNYNFTRAGNNTEDNIGFYYRYKFVYDHAGQHGSWQGLKYYGLYDYSIAYGGRIIGGSDTYVEVAVYSQDYEGKLYIITPPEESEGNSLYSYRPSGYHCKSFTNATSDYENFHIDSDWNGDTYVVSYYGLTNEFTNNGVCNINMDWYKSGSYSGGNSGGNESCGAGCVEFDNDGDFIQGSD